MKKQRFVSFLLVVALMIPLCTTAFAATGDTTTDTPITEVKTEGTTIQVPSKLNLPTISVTIGAPPEICVNPYKMSYTHPTLGVGQMDSVISAPTWIRSNSTLKMNVTAKPTATTTGNEVQFVTSDINDGIVTGDKKIYLTMTMDTVGGTGNAGLTAAQAYNGTNGTNTTTAPSTAITGDSSSISITMPAAASDNDNVATYAAFLIKGKSCGGNWNKNTDTPTITIVFNIEANITP